eukprot:TRINITY_DN7613_c0_g1_i1.p1 TRINITY_DN7613_c0_g1~~TRINITY_DN7613_c0_g1_i1.p1  ORF type:complete len:1350 (+),score=345.73 TRINITY_DN7613_c0_g1_i1:22-4050(+)
MPPKLTYAVGPAPVVSSQRYQLVGSRYARVVVVIPAALSSPTVLEYVRRNQEAHLIAVMLVNNAAKSKSSADLAASHQDMLALLPLNSLAAVAVIDPLPASGAIPTTPAAALGPLFFEFIGFFALVDFEGKDRIAIAGGTLLQQRLTPATLSAAFANLRASPASSIRSCFTLGGPPSSSGLQLPQLDPETEDVALVTPLDQIPEPTGDIVDQPETPYIKMLLQAFGERLVVTGATDFPSIWGVAQSSVAAPSAAAAAVPAGAPVPESSSSLNTKTRLLVPVAETFAPSPEYGLGFHLAHIKKRLGFIASVRAAVGEGVGVRGDISPELRSALQLWLSEQEDDSQLKSNRHARDVIALLDREVSTQPGTLLHMLHTERQLLFKPSRWVVGSAAWAADVWKSGMHHFLGLSENINVLIVETTPVSSQPDAPGNKKDLGLYALNYGTAYVASVALYQSYTHTLRAFLDADGYSGPSVVLAYMPSFPTDFSLASARTAANAAALQQLTETKKAVDSGLWPLYRFDPSLEKQGKNPFSIESERIKSDLQEFLDRENQLTLLASETPQLEPVLSSSLEQTEKHKYVAQVKLKSSFSKLLSGLANGTASAGNLLILFGSDGGNAERVAKNIEAEAKRRNIQVTRKTMDSAPLSLVASEGRVVFVVATAGQGEFPANAKEFWKRLSAVGDASLAAVKFAVFALGDSHYWPGADGARYFCKSGKDLDARLEGLGLQRLMPVGLGDDQDADQYTTALTAWLPELWTALGASAAAAAPAGPPPLSLDQIKINSNFLRGTFLTGLYDKSTGALPETDTILSKFHGIYQQDDRDLRSERQKAGMEKAFSFMIRARVPGGICSPAQWLAMDRVADERANGTIRITTRQAFQLHGVVKKNLRNAIRGINRSMMDTIAACGDVNRNVMCNPNPLQSEVHQQVYDFSCEFSTRLTPATRAYFEIWLNGEDDDVDGNPTAATLEARKKVLVGGDAEPIYGPTYLPRKFKTAIAIPPYNDVDVFAHDLGYIAIVEAGKLAGYNVVVGGGMGSTHGNKKTYPVVGKVMGFCLPSQAALVGEHVVTVQRDYGERTNRKHARLKYTIEDKGLDWFREQVEERCGFKLQPSRPYSFSSNEDRYGWTKGVGDTWHYCLFISNGRVKDTHELQLKTALKEIATIHTGDFRLTPNQHLIIANIKKDDRPKIQALLHRFGIDNSLFSGLRLSSMACVALPTCGLAMAESERYLPDLITQLEEVLDSCGLHDDSITIRMTGCPNGCARPFLAEIGMVGKAMGVYNLYLGAAHNGSRLNRLYKESLTHDQILRELTPMIKRYARERQSGEYFGDFVIRAGIIKAVTGNFWE